jgi:CSLREA domain-containing protein
MLAGAAVAMTLGGGAAPAQAAEITVTTTDDELNADGDCSLREAVQAANTDTAVDACAAGSGADVIHLPNGTYTLSLVPDGTPDDNEDGDLDVTADLTINGQTIDNTHIDGGAIDRVLDVHAGSLAVTMLTLRNGNTPDDGGGIRAGGLGLVIEQAFVHENTAAGDGGGIAIGGGASATVNFGDIRNNTAGGGGGGIWQESGDLIVDDFTTIGENTAGGAGGGIATDAGAALTVLDSQVGGNSAADGGGVWVGGDAQATIARTTIVGNAVELRGGGISNAGIFTITHSVVRGNGAEFAGGGIFNIGGTLSATNVTVSENFGTDLAGGVFSGAKGSGNLATLTNVTVADNDAAEGGGLYLQPGDTLVLKNTIVANNPTGGDCAVGSFTDNGNNIDSDGSCSLTDATSTTANPLLGPLEDNAVDPVKVPVDGNAVVALSHALLAGSPAIDTGDDAACPPDDQRGYIRPVDGDDDGAAVCDIGAFEFGALPPATPEPSATTDATPEGGPGGTVTGLPASGVADAESGAPWLVLAGLLALAGGAAAWGAVRLRSRS